ncbi:MAG: glycoside hydrolase family 1 protein [Pseudobdellovibrio sp.]
MFKIFILLFFSTLTLSADTQPFWWGVGHAAFQVEGSPADSDWSEWAHNPEHIADGNNADKGTDFWNHPEEDFRLAEELGAKMFRLSIAWERVEPAPNQFNEEALTRYENMLLKLREHHMEPMVTLYHFVIPNWLAKEGGLISPRFVDYFSEYELKVIQRLSNGPAKVRWWMTMNEPLVPVVAGYVIGLFPPGKKNVSEAVEAAKNLVKAQNQTMKLIHEDKNLPSDLQVSLAYHWRDVQAEGFGPLNFVARYFANKLANTWFLDSISPSTSLNYLGINYYGRYVLHLDWKPPFLRVDEGEGPKTDLEWTIYPEGLGHSLEEIYKLYHLPILISENGIADSQDIQRAEFIKSHVAEIKKAREKNIPVIGYLHWSLTDNFEWAEGLKPRFGLVEMDYKNMKRIPRKSFEVYKEIIKNGL